MRRPQHAARRAGFSLVELLAVIVILGILMTVLVTQMGGAGELARSKLTRSLLGQVESAIHEYETEFGDWPRSRFDGEAWGEPPNKTNLGGECLVLSLWSTKWGGVTLPEDQLGNSDGDRGKKQVASFPTLDLLELHDPWDNPIAYLHNRDYDRADSYATIAEDGAPIESVFRARKNPTTGGFFNSRGYQLASAGPDGEFGTDDDVCNFDFEPYAEGE